MLVSNCMHIMNPTAIPTLIIMYIKHAMVSHWQKEQREQIFNKFLKKYLINIKITL